MKGKYISTSLMLAVLAGSKTASSVFVEETKASTHDHTLIWSKHNGTAKKQIVESAGGGELKIF